MSGPGIGRGLLAGLALGLAAPAAAEVADFSQIERGRYLATASNCIACHTDIDNRGEPWSGGREMETPFGPIVTPNITFDDETGLGRWSRDDFWNALHNGIRRDGSPLYPAFPYPYFTRMPRQDVDAIYDYLSTLPPIRAEHEPEAGLPAPLRIRTLVHGWNLLHFSPGVFEPDPARSEEWNRGAYLVQGPGHCAACHTPKTLTGADRSGEFLRGGVLEHWLAPNIRGGANGGIEHWSEDEIVDYLGTGRNAHTAAMTRMGEVVQLSTQHLDGPDLRAIAHYLKDLDDEPRDTGAAPSEAAMTAGRTIYFDNCAACHRADGSGVPGIFAVLDGSNKVRSTDPSTVLRIILQGAQAVPTDAHPGPLGMPAYDWKLSDEQIADVASYIRNAWGNDAPPVSAGDVADMREAIAD